MDRSTCYVVPQFSCSGFIVASTIILLFSDITMFVLTNIRPHLSFSLRHVLYILTMLIKPRPKLLCSLKPVPYTRPDFCSTSNLRCRLLMEQAAHSEHVCICRLVAADFVRVHRSTENLFVLVNWLQQILRVHRSVRLFVQIISLHAGVSP